MFRCLKTTNKMSNVNQKNLLYLGIWPPKPLSSPLNLDFRWSECSKKTPITFHTLHRKDFRRRREIQLINRLHRRGHKQCRWPRSGSGREQAGGRGVMKNCANKAWVTTKVKAQCRNSCNVWCWPSSTCDVSRNHDHGQRRVSNPPWCYSRYCRY